MLTNLPITEVALLLGVTPNAVRLWHRKLRKPSKTTEQLAQLIELTRMLAPAAFTAYRENLLIEKQTEDEKL